jgi:hypothetical protein
MSEEQAREWAAWLESRPPVVRRLAERFPVNKLFRLKEPGQRVTVRSYLEDGTMTVNVTGQYNRVLFSRTVFGVSADDLEECDLPGPNEDLGDTAAEAGYTEDDIRNILIPKIYGRTKT